MGDSSADAAPGDLAEHDTSRQTLAPMSRQPPEPSAHGAAPRISVVLAAHNEAACIAEVIAAVQATLEARAVTYEIIVIDDGSVDETAALARRAGARVVRLWPNRGKGVALRRGVLEARGAWLVFLDADGQDDPAEIPLLLAVLDEDPQVAMVNGSRFLGELREGAISAPNRVGNVVMTALLDAAFLRRITDSQAGFRVVRADIARALPFDAAEYEIETEMLGKLLRRGERVVEVPVTRYQRGGGQTDFRRVRNGLRILWRIARERVRAR